MDSLLEKASSVAAIHLSQIFLLLVLSNQISGTLEQDILLLNKEKSFLFWRFSNADRLTHVHKWYRSSVSIAEYLQEITLAAKTREIRVRTVAFTCKHSRWSIPNRVNAHVSLRTFTKLRYLRVNNRVYGNWYTLFCWKIDNSWRLLSSLKSKISLRLKNKFTPVWSYFFDVYIIKTTTILIHFIQFQ